MSENASLRSLFQTILDNYLHAKKKPFGENSGDITSKAFRELTSKLNQNVLGKSQTPLSSKYSIGIGKWTHTPWLSISDNTQSSSTQEGPYCVYIFRQDMSGFYLCFGLGVVSLIEELGKVEGTKALQKQVQAYQKSLNANDLPGFTISSAIDLKASGGVGTSYSAGTIAFKFYDKNSLPDDTQILSDLTTLTQVYVRKTKPTRYWVCGAIWNDNEDMSESFIEDGVWQNGYDDKHIEKVKSVAVGDKIAIKSAFATKQGESVLRIKGIGTVTGNMKDGKTITVNWNKGIQTFDIKGITKRETIHEITDPKEIQSIFNQDKVTMQRKNTVGPDNVIYYGPPGTGKTWTIKTDYLKNDTVKGPSSYDPSLLDQHWHVLIALVIDQLGNSCTVPQIASHDLIVKKATHLKRDKNINATVWSTLQSHTIRESTTVRYEKRFGELLFDKNDSGWFLPNGLPDSIKELKNSSQTLLPAENKNLPKFVTFHQSFGYEEFVEGIKPLDESHPLNENGEGLTYKTVDGIFKQACAEALEAAGYEGSIDSFCSLTPDQRMQFMQTAPIYNFCIDEINRANCSKVFGELITLIEPDKRLGGEHETILKLPYSNEKFGVPSNIRIIGTMNTADRSVESLDNALRRRFSFKHISPDSTLLSNIDTLDLQRLLSTMNDRIEVISDQDKAIGHAYLLNIQNLEDLKKAFKNKIIPLLSEYFFGDLEKVGLVLGSTFIYKKKKNANLLANFDSDLRDEYHEKKLYQVANLDELTLKDFEQIYETT